MKKDKHYIVVLIKDELDLLKCSHKRALSLTNILELQNGLDENYSIHSYFVKDTEKINNIAVVKNIKKFEALNIAVLKTNFNKHVSLRLKDRKQNENKHFLIIFSTEEDRLLVNENNYSYFYDIGSLLTGSFKESLLNIVMEKTKWEQ